MAHEKEHPIAGIVFLVFVGALVVLAAKGGIEKSREADLKQAVVDAVMIGDSGELEQARQKLEAILRRNPEHVGAMFFLASVEYRLHRFDEADKLYAAVLAREPEDWESVAERAAIAKKKGNIEAAIAMMERIPKGQGHVQERLMDEVWFDLFRDARLRPLLEKHNVGQENSVRVVPTSTKAEP